MLASWPKGTRRFDSRPAHARSSAIAWSTKRPEPALDLPPHRDSRDRVRVRRVVSNKLRSNKLECQVISVLDSKFLSLIFYPTRIRSMSIRPSEIRLLPPISVHPGALLEGRTLGAFLLAAADRRGLRVSRLFPTYLSNSHAGRPPVSRSVSSNRQQFSVAVLPAMWPRRPRESRRPRTESGGRP